MDKEYSLNEIKSEIDRLAAQIGAPDDLLPTYGYSEDGARPHIEIDSHGYHYVVVERGEEINRVTTNSLDELLSVLSPKWAEIESKDHERILQQHPYHDSLTHN